MSRLQQSNGDDYPEAAGKHLKDEEPNPMTWQGSAAQFARLLLKPVHKRNATSLRLLSS